MMHQEYVLIIHQNNSNPSPTNLQTNPLTSPSQLPHLPSPCFPTPIPTSTHGHPRLPSPAVQARRFLLRRSFTRHHRASDSHATGSLATGTASATATVHAATVAIPHHRPHLQPERSGRARGLPCLRHPRHHPYAVCVWTNHAVSSTVREMSLLSYPPLKLSMERALIISASFSAWAAIICCWTCLGCIPYLINGLKDVTHNCGHCGVLVATWHRSGRTVVHVHA